jgi:histidine ammonia-lyase
MQHMLGSEIQLDEQAVVNIRHCRKYLDDKMKTDGGVFYGINTGFGSLCNVKISNEDIQQLQENLVLSHACGIGDEVPSAIVKWMLLLKIKNFTYGHSGVSPELVNRLIDMYNRDILPVVYQLGSLGASGDLAPLAHLSLPLLGEGEVVHRGVKQTSSALWASLENHSSEQRRISLVERYTVYE